MPEHVWCLVRHTWEMHCPEICKARFAILQSFGPLKEPLSLPQGYTECGAFLFVHMITCWSVVWTNKDRFPFQERKKMPAKCTERSSSTFIYWSHCRGLLESRLKLLVHICKKLNERITRGMTAIAAVSLPNNHGNGLYGSLVLLWKWEMRLRMSSTLCGQGKAFINTELRAKPKNRNRWLRAKFTVSLNWVTWWSPWLEYISANQKIPVRKYLYHPGLQIRKCCCIARGKDQRDKWDPEWEHLEVVHLSLKGKMKELAAMMCYWHMEISIF